MDWSLWQTCSAFDLLHSSYMWRQTILVCGKHSITIQIRIVSRLWFCRRPWRLEVNIRWNIVHFRKSNICAKKLDVQETDTSFTQLNGSHFSWCRFTHGWNFRAWSLGHCDCWSISFLTKSNQQNQRSEVAGELVAKHHTPREKPKSNKARQSGSEQCWSRFVKRKIISIWCCVYVFDKQWSRD